jgi:hypothetical protein
MTGESCVVQWHYNGGTYVLSGDFTNFSQEWSMQSADVTAGSDGGVYPIPTLEEFSFSLDSFYTGTADASSIWAYVKPGYAGTIIFAPKGTAAPQPKGGGVCFVSSKPLAIPFNEGISRTVEFTGQGTLLYDVDSSTW